MLAGFVQAWGARFYIDPDGVNYLDIADAYLRHDWHAAINGYWSPMYSWLLAAAKWLFRPAPYWESTLLHALNFALFLLALVCFEFFFRRLLAASALRFSGTLCEQGLPLWAWWVLGYTAFLFAALRLISLSNTTPDMALAALLFLAAGLLINFVLGLRGTLRYAAFGLVLGLAYLTKGVMFPLAFAYLAAAAFASGRTKPDTRAAAALASFVVVALPFGFALSREKGHLTFGDTGKYAYFNQVTAPDTSKLLHPLPRLSDNPSVFEYTAARSQATYPPWYDGTYWAEGATLRFNIRDQARAIARNFENYFRIASGEKDWIAAFLILAVVGSAFRTLASRWFALWFVWLPSIIMLAAYTLVLVEPRYVAVAMSILWLALFAALPWEKIAAVPRLGSAAVLAIALITGIALVREQIPYAAACLRPPLHQQWLAAAELRRMELTSGDRVAVLGHTTVADYWAHLAGLTIAADVPLQALSSYWSASPQKREEIFSSLASLGIKAIVTHEPPVLPERWQALGQSGYYVRILQATPAKSASAQRTREPLRVIPGTGHR